MSSNLGYCGAVASCRCRGRAAGWEEWGRIAEANHWHCCKLVGGFQNVVHWLFGQGYWVVTGPHFFCLHGIKERVTCHILPSASRDFPVPSKSSIGSEISSLGMCSPFGRWDWLDDRGWFFLLSLLLFFFLNRSPQKKSGLLLRKCVCLRPTVVQAGSQNRLWANQASPWHSVLCLVISFWGPWHSFCMWIDQSCVNSCE